jgi:SOS-response transcriptional repressor LexA
MNATSPEPLTARQEEILAIITRLYREHGFPPTVRMLVNVTGVSGTNGVMSHLTPLVKKGALRRATVEIGGIYTVRYLPVVPEGCCPCCGRPT